MGKYKSAIWKCPPENTRRALYDARGVSAFCGISRAYYGRVERGEHSATLEICQKISEATGLSFSELFEDIV